MPETTAEKVRLHVRVIGDIVKGLFGLAVLILIGVVIYSCSTAPTKTPEQLQREINAGLNQVIHSQAIVWVDSAAKDRGNSLIAAGVAQTHFEKLAPLIACIVPPGTHIVLTDGGMFSSKIMVNGGEHDGCEGVISNEYFWESTKHN